MKILVAMPVYDRSIPTETARCLFEEQLYSVLGGDVLAFRFLPACSHVAMGRNQLAKAFMESEFDRLVFLDSDVTFEPGDLLKLAKRPEDLVGGAYRFKIEPEAYPVGWLDQKWLRANDQGLLEVAGLPGGFMAISRNVFEQMKAAHPEREFEHCNKKLQCYFEMRFEGGQLFGEDIYFCKQWRELGGKVFLDPEIALTHWDHSLPYRGHIGNWLKRNSGVPTKGETNGEEKTDRREQPGSISQSEAG